MPHLNQSSFPEAVIIILGTKFPTSEEGTGFYGLHSDEPIVLQKAAYTPPSPVEYIEYTENKTLVPSLPTTSPNVPIGDPPNRLWYRVGADNGTIGYLEIVAALAGMGLPPYFMWIDYADDYAAAKGWGPFGTMGYNAHVTAWAKATYNFLDIFNRPIHPNNFFTDIILSIEEYFVPLEVSATHGTVEITVGGVVTAQPAIGDIVTVTATPETGYTFISWEQNGIVLSTDIAYSFTMPFRPYGESYAFEAVFGSMSGCITRDVYLSIAMDYSNAVEPLVYLTDYYYDAANIILYYDNMDVERDLLLPFFTAYVSADNNQSLLPAMAIEAVRQLQMHVLKRSGSETINDWYDSVSINPDTELTQFFKELSEEAGYTIE